MKKTTKKLIFRSLLGVGCLFILFNIAAFVGVGHAYNKVFRRCEMADYDSTKLLVYSDFDSIQYPRERMRILSGKNQLDAFLYAPVKSFTDSLIRIAACAGGFMDAVQHSRGLVIVTPGHQDYSSIKLPEIVAFADYGWSVLCFDLTGCYGSTGKNMKGYTQSVRDLDAVLRYVESDDRFNSLPIMLFGHSKGAYASTAVMHFPGHRVSAIVAASGLNSPVEQWRYTVYKSTGVLGGILSPYANLVAIFKQGSDSRLTAIEGINAAGRRGIPVLLYAGTEDPYFGQVSSIYAHRDLITNPNCHIRVQDKENHRGHTDYFYTDSALASQELVHSLGHLPPDFDKHLYVQHDPAIMADINAFFSDALPKP